MNSETHWIKIVKQRMTQLNIKLEHLAQLMGMTPGGVRHYLNGNREPSLEQFLHMLTILNLQDCSITEILAAQKNFILPKCPSPIISHCPVLTWEDAIYWPNNKDKIFEEKLVELLETKLVLSADSYALEVEGNLMQTEIGRHSFPEGTYLIVEPEKKYENGSFVIAKKEGAEKLLFRQYTKDDIGNEFLSIINTNYKKRSIDFDTHTKVCGVVVAHLDILV